MTNTNELAYTIEAELDRLSVLLNKILVEYRKVLASRAELLAAAKDFVGLVERQFEGAIDEIIPVTWFSDLKAAIAQAEESPP